MDKAWENSVDEAVEWMIALQEDPSDPELMDRFERWRCTSEANALAWQQILRTKDVVRSIDQTSGEHESLEPAPAVLAVEERAHGSRSKRLAGIVVVAAAACLLLLAWPQIRLSLEADHLTGAGETRKVELADGSIVHLGAESAISVAYDKNSRNVELLAGQAFFSVHRDAARPFRVRFGEAETVVLGTRFEVSMTSRGAAVAVSDGSVLVRFPDNRSGQQDAQSRLTRGDAVRLGWDGAQPEQMQVEPETVASWRTGKLVVDNWPVADVVDELRRHFRGTIVVGDVASSARRITGIYDLSNPEQALRLVAATQGASVYRISPWVLVIPGL